MGSPMSTTEAPDTRVAGCCGASAPCKLFVGGISANTTTEALRMHFSKYGRLIDAVVMSKNGRPRGFGFVTYDTLGPAVMALAEPQWLDGRLVDVKRAVPGDRAQERTSNKIFVGGLPQDVSTEDLKAYFSNYGSVADAVVMVDRRTSRSRGFGFVRFANGAQGSVASEAVLMDFASHRLGGKWVEVKRATPAAVLQALAPCGELGAGSPGALAAAEQQLGTCFMDLPGPEAGFGPGASTSPAATPARGHARGRRGRRRKQRSSTSEWSPSGTRDDISDGEECGDDLSPCSVILSGSSPVAFTPAKPCGVPCAAAVWSSTPRKQAPRAVEPLSPLTVEPLDCCGLSPLALAAGEGRAQRPVARGGASENDPARANAATVHSPPGLLAGTNMSPMKIACRDDCFGAPAGPRERFEGFTREDFLSLEVRPWLSAW